MYNTIRKKKILTAHPNININNIAINIIIVFKMNKIKIGSVVRLNSCESILFTVTETNGVFCDLIGYISETVGVVSFKKVSIEALTLVR